MELLRIDLPKPTSSILIEIVSISVVLVDELHSYMHHQRKAWLFEKIIFELVYLFHIVLYPIKAGGHSKSTFVGEGRA